MVDLWAFLLIVLPLYPKTAAGYVYSVNLLVYTEVSEWNRVVYWVMFLALVLLGVLKVLLMPLPAGKLQKAVTGGSLGLGILTVLFLALGGETYAVVVAFLLLIFKGMLVFRFSL